MKRREEEREEGEEEEEEEEEEEKEDGEEEGEDEEEREEEDSEEGEEEEELEEEEEEGAEEEEETLAEGDGVEDEVGGGDDEDVKKKSSKQAGAADRKCVPGIIYLGHIPPRLRPKHLRNMLSVYGEIGRVFLQPEDGQVKKRKRKSRCDFTEGWVEFTDKRVAKRVAASLHNTPMGTRKRQRFASDLWSIKYLHRFHWTHLSERLAYEKTVLQQRLRTEVSQAKKETNFYLNNVERSAQMEKGKKKRRRDGEQVEERTWDFTQRQTEEEIQQRKKKRKNLDKARLIQQKSQSNVSLLAKIFNSNKSE